MIKTMYKGKGLFMCEIWDVYDADRNKTGKTVFRGEDMAAGEYHLVADVWIMNSRGEILVQKRSMQKAHGAGLWCCTGGAALAGENHIEAFVREMTEELGVPPDTANAEIAFSYVNDDRHYHKDVWFVRQDIPEGAFHLQAEEVDAVRWMTLEDLIREMEDPALFWQFAYMEDIILYLREKRRVG